jgi:peptidyl-tRNA hydrolase, PTH1 family
MAQLRLVAGLGNPGTQYIDTRHNAGFMVVDCLARKQNLKFTRSASWSCEWAKWGETVLAKPLTFMNRSGDAVGAVARYYKIEPSEILVIVDDVALPLGRLRLRLSGSDGGHNGLKSVIDHLGETFLRLRVGIGAAPGAEQLVGHVLGRFAAAEKEIVQTAIARATEAVEHIAEKGMSSAMNLYNRAE